MKWAKNYTEHPGLNLDRENSFEQQLQQLTKREHGPLSPTPGALPSLKVSRLISNFQAESRHNPKSPGEPLYYHNAHVTTSR